MKGKRQEDKIGPWIKAEQVRRRVESDKEGERHQQQGGKSWREGRPRKPTPVSLLKDFSNLTVQEKPQSNRLTGIEKAEKVNHKQDPSNVEEERVMQILRKEDRKALLEISDEDIMTITYNGVTFEGKAGDTHLSTKEKSNQIKELRKGDEMTEMMIFISEPLENSKTSKQGRLKQLAQFKGDENKHISGAKRRTLMQIDDEKQKKVCIEAEVEGSGLHTAPQDP